RIAGHASLADRIDVAIEARGVDLAAIVPDAKGLVEADLKASGSPEDPAFEGRIHAPDLAWGARKVAIEASFKQADRVLSVESLDLDAGDLAKLQGRGRLPAISWSGGKIAFAPVEDAAFTLHGTATGAAAWTEVGLRNPSRLSDLTVDVEAKGRDLS